MGSSKQVVVLVAVALITTQAVLAYDPTITTDYGIKMPSSGENFTFRGFEPSKLPPGTAGLTLVPAFVAQFPGVKGLGLSSLYFNIGPGAEVPPHSHPRASELFFVLTGSWIVGFIDTNGAHFTTVLHSGDQFVFPIGLLHYQYVSGKERGLGVSAFNSENPGVALTATSLFASNPTILNQILANAFNISVNLIQKIKAGLGGA